jgi:hypothetical protein
MLKGLFTSTALAMLVGALIANSALAENRPAPTSHMMITTPHHQGTPAGIAHQMPPRGFRDTPPSFRGSIPRRATAPAVSKRVPNLHPVGRPGNDLASFRGHKFTHFSPAERSAWQGGRWRYAWHRGHRGWWWIVGGLWYFYPAPIYPYPLYIGSLDYYDYYDWYGTPDYYWYYCTNPQGYYPYIQECLGTWHAVPPAPE